MKEFIEKLIGRLEEYPTYSFGVSLLNTKEYIKVSDLIEIVNKLAEEYKGGWIPCSERLPEVNGWYLVTNELGIVQQQHWGASHWRKLRDEAVIAWMPLPEPYHQKGE